MSKDFVSSSRLQIPTYIPGFHDDGMVSKMRYNTLGDTGLQVSVLSFGASSLGSVFRLTDEGESIQVVHEALKHGINYIDTAPWYGHGKSETVLGKALKDIPRDSYYIATKVCRYQPEVEKQFDFSAQRTIESVDESLQRLGLPYVDFIQVHDMEFAPSLDIVINETLPALQKVKESGKARFIGITGYPLENFRTVIDRSCVKIDTVLTYCRGSMNDNALSNFIPYFKSKGVGIVNASPISMGLLSNRGPPAWHPAHQHIKDVCAAAATFCSENRFDGMFRADFMANGVDISRLAMDFTLSQPDYDTTLVSTASLKNLYKNIESVYCPLTDQETTIQQQVLERYMKPLKNRHWEGVEVEQYRKELAAVQ